MALIYQFRYFINQLCIQLAVEHRKIKDLDELTVYRGDHMRMEDFEKLKNNVGFLICTNSFFSTSRNRVIAEIFAEQELGSDHLVSIVFDIKVNPRLLQFVVFADIESFSQMPDEKEILFSLGSTFKIISVTLEPDSNIASVQLDASDEGFDRIQQYFIVADNDMRCTSPMVYFGQTLYSILGEPFTALDYFEELLKTLPKDHSDLADIYDAMGNAYSEIGKSSLTYKYFKKADAIRRKQKIPNSVSKIQPEEEKTYLKELLDKFDTEKNNSAGDSLKKAELMLKIGWCFEADDKILWFNRGIDMYDRLQVQQPSVCDCLNELMWVYGLKGDFTRARRTRYRLLDVQEHYLPPDNSELQDTLDAIVGECKNIFEYRKALEYCETRLSSLSQLHSDDHPRVVHMRKFANKMTERIHTFKQNQAKYTETLRSTIDDSEKTIGLLYQLKSLYYEFGLFFQCLHYGLQELQMNQKLYGANHKKVGDSIQNIGMCYSDMHDYCQASSYMREALARYESDPKACRFSIQLCRTEIARLERKILTNRCQVSTRSNVFNDDLSINASRINTTFNIQTTTIRKRANSLP